MLVLVLVFEDSPLSSLLCAPVFNSTSSITYPLSSQPHSICQLSFVLVVASISRSYKAMLRMKRPVFIPKNS